MAGVLSQLDQFKPSSGMFGGAMDLITFAILLVIFAMFIGIIGYIVIMRRKFKTKIKVFAKEDGRWKLVAADVAAEYPVGRLGDRVWYLKKHKKYIPKGDTQTGPNTYWYYIRSKDDEWINFGLTDIDKQLKSMNIHFRDKGLALARAGMEESLAKRYDKPSIWSQYGVIIVSVSFVVLMGIMTYLLFDKWIELAQTTNSGVENAAKVQETSKETMLAIDHLITQLRGTNCVEPG